MPGPSSAPAPLQVAVCSSDYLPSIGGVAAHVHELARALQGLGHVVRVVGFAPTGWGVQATEQDGVRAVRLPLAAGPGGKGRFWRFRRFAKNLPRLCGFTAGPYVLHVHDCDHGHYVAEFAGGPVTRMFTNHTSGFLQDIEENSVPEGWVRRFKMYDGILAPSQELADGVVNCKAPAAKVRFLPNGVDADRFKPDAALRQRVREELGVPAGDVVVLCARRFVAKNGVIDFAHGLRQLAAVADRTTVLFAGNQPHTTDTYEKETVGAVKRSPVGAKARFLGAVPNAQMQRLYAAADVGVLPSLKEATSITGLESMACGLPLVGTSIGGIPDLIDHDRTGFLVEYGNPQAFGAAVARLVADPALRERFGRQARQKVLDQFTWGRVAARTTDFYRACQGGPADRTASRPALPENPKLVGVS